MKINNNKKTSFGFTLVEVLGVIIILSFLAFLISEVIINNVEDTNKRLETLATDIIISSAREYVELNPNEFPKVTNSSYYIEYKQLEDKKLISDNMLPDIEKKDELKQKYIKVEYNGNNYIYFLVDEKI